MRAIGIEEFGGPEVLRPITLPQPVPLPTELLVKVRAAGVNPLDLRTRAGFSTPAAAALGTSPHILGWDVSGVVEEAGDGVHLFAPGDEVFGLLWLPRPAGAYAEYVTAPSRQFARKPGNVDHAHAAAVPLAGLTAWQALTEIAQLKPGQRILIHAAGGGVGHLAVQIAKKLGAYVIGTASQSKHDWLRGLGADEMVDYRTVSFEDVVDEVDVVLDLVGIAQPDTSVRSLSVLRPDGLFVGVAPGVPAGFSQLARAAGIRTSLDLLVEPDGHGLSQLAALIESGELKVNVEKQFDLLDAVAAHQWAEQNRSSGKVVLTISELKQPGVPWETPTTDTTQ